MTDPAARTEQRRLCGHRGCTEPAYRCDGCDETGCEEALRRSCRCDGGPDASPLYAEAVRDAEPSDDLDCFTDGADDSSHLRNLLAIIHGDGGHHTAAVGVAQSCRDAEAEFHRLRLLSPQRQAQQPGTATLDLDAVAIRSHAAAKYVGSGGERAGFAWRSALDVHDLVAEVLRVREELATQERVTAALGDLARATINALRGEPPHLTTWSTHDLPNVAREVRDERDALRARVAELERLAAGPSTREPMGFAEAIDAVRRGPVGPSGCARCGEIATAACDACGVHLCSVCGATPTCDDGDPCALRRYPHPDKEPLLCVDLDAWGRALG